MLYFFHLFLPTKLKFTKKSQSNNTRPKDSISVQNSQLIQYYILYLIYYHKHNRFKNGKINTVHFPFLNERHSCKCIFYNI